MEKTCGFDFYILGRKLKEEILNGRIEKIYFIEREKGYIAKFVVHKQEKKILIITNDCCFIYKNDIIENPLIPSTFTMVLRKYLEDKFIMDVCSCNNDKILSLKTKDNIVYFEFFGSGNIVLCNNENKIIDALIKREWKGRVIKQNEIYKFPENMKPERLTMLFFGRYFNEVKDIGFDDGIKILENKEKEILEMFKNLTEHRLMENPEIEKIEKEIKKLEFVAELQRKRKEELEREAMMYSKIGNEIYQNFNVINEILENARNRIKDSRIKKEEGNYIIVEI